MGYQRGERGRLGSLITVVILGAAVVSIDHISGRSIRPPARSEAANQVISMDLGTTANPELAAVVQPDGQQCASTGCRRQVSAKLPATKTACREIAPGTNSLKLKTRELQDTDWPMLARLSGITKKPLFLELQIASIPPLEKRTIAAASHLTAVKSVSIRMDGEVRINKVPDPAPASLYLIRASIGKREADRRERVFRSQPALALPPIPLGWKCGKPTS